MAGLDLTYKFNSNRVQAQSKLCNNKKHIIYFSRMLRLNIQSVKGGHINRVPHDTLGKDFGSRLCWFHFISLRSTFLFYATPTLGTRPPETDAITNELQVSDGFHCWILQSILEQDFIDSSYNWYLICLNSTTIPNIWKGYISKSSS